MPATSPDRAVVPEAVGRAHRTLMHACDFWVRHARLAPAPCSAAPRFPGRPVPAIPSSLALSAFTRMSGNRLHELDRFLSVLLDAVAAGHGGDDHDDRHFASRHNTSGKMLVVEGMLGMERHARARLLAIGRISALLRHCPSPADTPALRADLQLALGRDTPCPPRAAPDSPILTRDSVLVICRFYAALGDRVLAAAAR
ncbi:hypothetical protein [Novosphingobium sp. ST904]|uniref:hypothetical protein n=1 Tax=Novosphingobium sp. ST904 TaxID=1684385 RepID=UPI00104D57EE|nr:hypothetical protein [Novosphingobium sp. ST904]